MSTSHYKRLLTVMPSMAAVVNSFQSEEVQQSAFRALMQALDEYDGEKSGRSETIASSRRPARENSPREDDLAHDIAEGDNIHDFAEESLLAGQ